MPKHITVRNGHSKPDKVLTYLPAELGKQVQVSFYLHKPKEIHSQVLALKKNALLIVDSNLDKATIDLTLFLLKKHVKQITVYKLNYGPKNISQVEKIWETMIQTHPDVAIALGGGTTCDLVGFASSCYQRSLDHVFFPTTLLSMVDACIGGKTGIDFGGVKNSVGQVHYALESHCIFPFLQTLDKAELISGFSEVIKAGMLFDEELVQLIEKLPSTFNVSKDWFNVVSRGAELKTRISEQPFSQRSKLLYGHNIGHGYETFNSLHRRHGDCVSIGMNYELALGVAAGVVDRDIWFRQKKLLSKFNLPVKFRQKKLLSKFNLPVLMPKRTNFEKVKAKMRKYKLYSDNTYLFIIPRKPGEIIEINNDYYWKLNDDELNVAYDKARKLILQ